MTPFPFMISVQWGKGHHFFIGGAFNMQAALVGAKAQHALLERRLSQLKKKHNLKPRVMVWELRESIQSDEVGPIVWNIELPAEPGVPVQAPVIIL